MICHRCLRVQPQLQCASTIFAAKRLFSTSRPNSQPESPPAATSTSAAQPFSTPFTSSPARSTDSTSTSPASKQSLPSRPKSSVKAGTALKGLAFLKNKEPPVAKEDDEYPSWLWGLLDKAKGETQEGGAEGDLFSKSAKKRRIAARIARRSASTSTAESRAPPVPLHEQSIDLPSAPQNRFGRNVDVQAGEKAREAREELTASMRQKRRKNIREANFLKGMR
ncbi:MAG: hypothetical protein L6R39_005576 [Caloplaca ligustica]|nr:MAG: hypothetical protein L6R39_005576 [Caloplaca ligustica]